MGKQAYIDYLHNIFVDALCCCQANDVPRWCEGSCRSGRAKQYIYNLTETPKNDYTIWMVSVISEVLIDGLRIIPSFNIMILTTIFAFYFLHF